MIWWVNDHLILLSYPNLLLPWPSKNNISCVGGILFFWPNILTLQRGHRQIYQKGILLLLSMTRVLLTESSPNPIITALLSKSSVLLQHWFFREVIVWYIMCKRHILTFVQALCLNDCVKRGHRLKHISCARGILLLLSRPNVLLPPGGGETPARVNVRPRSQIFLFSRSLATVQCRCIVSVLRHEFLWRVKFVPGFV